ncbi:hypothetical protein SXCC_01598 [Gluconacetobacter sp. SXCC-1]|uniref:hypothetical protein n=1 Tax=Komagataeibacter rhaeticus TaxID=215221 RepID=UPI000207FE24|nr:hypothetical protein [Komagataeibacter rhaeticus]EGG77654.1 hypothetical protein SXCC_01598 [Gluconacetobacter sp. SXCC-1]WPP21258.1 hypothetical protein SCD25_12660 [Komagataeibacter rhaeticus]SAY49707.1 hypothetical protein KRIGEM_02688 [Komagataeibacter rhaeticus]
MGTPSHCSTTPPDKAHDPAHIQFRIALHHDRVVTASRPLTPTPAWRSLRSIALLGLALALAGTGLSACKRHHETAGEKLDHFGDKVQDTLDPPKGPGEKAGRTIDRTLHDN